MPWSRRAGRCGCAGRRPGTASDQRGNTGGNRVFHLLRADEVDVGIDATRSEDLPFAGNDLSARPNDDVDIWLNVWIASLSDLGDAAIGDANISLHDAPVINDQRICDHRIDSPFCMRHLRLTHTVTDHLAAAELYLLTVNGEIAFHLNYQI